MRKNIAPQDLDVLVESLRTNPRLTQSDNVRRFEAEWSRWLGVKYSVFVNSGASANLITMAALRHLHGPGEVIVPTLTWVSDIASVLHAGLTPIFVDIDPATLCMDGVQVLTKLTSRTRGVFLTHVQGYNGLTEPLLSELRDRSTRPRSRVCFDPAIPHEEAPAVR